MSKTSNSLIAKLEELDERFSEIEEQISDLAVASDVKRHVPLSKEQGKLKPIVSKYREYKEMLGGIGEAEAMLKEPGLEEEMRKGEKSSAK